MAPAPPPLVGFNNNVRYRGLRFHIQTEDSGIRRPHVSTHLFANGGQVIRTIRRDYTEHLENPDRAVLVREMMMEQHNAMAIALRRGKLDELLGSLEGLKAPERQKTAAGPSTVSQDMSSQNMSSQGTGGDSPKTQISPALSGLGTGPSALSHRKNKAPSSRAPAQPISAPFSGQPANADGKRSPQSETMMSLHPTSPDDELPLHIPLAPPIWRGSRPPTAQTPDNPSSSSPARPASRAPATQTSPDAAPISPRKPVGRPSPRMLRAPTSASLFGTTPEPSLDDAILGYLSSHSKRTTGKSK